MEWLAPRFRSGDELHWLTIRRLLREKSIDVESAWLANIWTDDVCAVTGWVVTATGNVFEFDYAWPESEGEDSAIITRWLDVTDVWSDRYQADHVRAALHCVTAD